MKYITEELRVKHLAMLKPALNAIGEDVEAIFSPINRLIKEKPELFADYLKHTSPLRKGHVRIKFPKRFVLSEDSWINK